MAVEDEISDRLGTKKFHKLTSGLGGCVNTGTVYEIDDGKKIYVKSNSDSDSGLMFQGELCSLEAIAATSTIRVPKPNFMLDFTHKEQGAFLVMEYVDLKGLKKYQAQCGEKLAKLHLDNFTLEMEEKKLENWIGKEPGRPYINQFGFDTVTCCGKIPYNNDWANDWELFYARNRLDVQMRLLQSAHGHRECNELWSKLQLIIPKFFKPLKDRGITIAPSLLHGDLWGGNAGETEEGPIVFDPAAFYGHHEFDLSISGMFGGFQQPFYSAYFTGIKKASGFDERQELYQLFHYLNHWNHFGGGYAEQSLRLMRKLTAKY